ncbi:MAG: ATP-binding cassette domain-containing protein [Planctomycetaceae bacterium]|nr:ATP-binding cassette domain-containing protein [Planctomycetaceae bacterium]
MTSPDIEEQTESQQVDAAVGDDTLFDLQSLTCRYRQQVAVNDISVRLTPGKLIAVCGYSGSGKSTLLNTLGLLRYGRIFSGSIRLHLPGQVHDYSQISSKTRRYLRREEFGFVLQSSYLLPNISGRHNIEMPLLIQKKPAAFCAEQVKSLVDHLCDDPEQRDLLPVLDRVPKEASGGQRQRIAILRALVHDPTVVFADEPCANLDPLNAETVMHLLQKWLKDGIESDENQPSRTILLVSHDIESVLNFADQTLILREGKIVDGRLFERNDFPARLDLAKDELKSLMRNGPI